MTIQAQSDKNALRLLNQKLHGLEIEPYQIYQELILLGIDI